MRKSRFSEGWAAERTNSIGVLKERQAGLPVADLRRKHGISDATFYNWRSRCGGMEVSEAKRLKALKVSPRGRERSQEHAMTACDRLIAFRRRLIAWAE